MSIKAAVSALALTSAMLVAPAFAQDAAATPSWTIGGNAVAEGDQAAVQAKCDELALESNSSLSDSTEEGAAAGTNTTDEDPTRTSDQPPAEGLDNATTTIDLTTITLENCNEGGWLMNNETTSSN